MLRELKVENLALIESLHLCFDQEAIDTGGRAASDSCAEAHGLVVMTGETGAGKSILLRAIHLLMGGRTQTDWIRSGAEQCTVEALFVVSNSHHELLKLLLDAGLDDGHTIILKRILTSNGRSRLYINGSLATARMVALVAENMVNVASQHDHQQLLQPSLHLDFLDTLGNHWEERELVGKSHALWLREKEALHRIRQQEQDKEQRKDFLAYQLAEIQQAAPVIGEDEQLVAERKRLKNAEALISLTQNVYRFFSSTIVDGLFEVRRNMEQATQLDPSVEKLAAEMAAYGYQAEDIVSQVRKYKDSLEHNPARLEQVNERLNTLQHLKRKYGATMEAVLQFAANAEKELQQIENMDKIMKELEAAVAAAEQVLVQQAAALSGLRRHTAEQMGQAMATELASLAFHQAQFIVHFQEHDSDLASVRANGWDRVEFFFSANPGEMPKPLAKVASGGELSRLMLALKCLLAQKDRVETVIFDEVDSGIGGEAAEAVARKIQELAGHHQVFCVTHLPQIAARGATHFTVAKQITDGRVSSSFTFLREEERIDELARMLAGESVSASTREWASELLKKGKKSGGGRGV